MKFRCPVPPLLPYSCCRVKGIQCIYFINIKVCKKKCCLKRIKFVGTQTLLLRWLTLVLLPIFVCIFDCTFMVPNKCPIIGKQVGYLFSTQQVTTPTHLILLLGHNNSKKCIFCKVKKTVRSRFRATPRRI